MSLSDCEGKLRADAVRFRESTVPLSCEDVPVRVRKTVKENNTEGLYTHAGRTVRQHSSRGTSVREP